MLSCGLAFTTCLCNARTLIFKESASEAEISNQLSHQTILHFFIPQSSGGLTQMEKEGWGVGKGGFRERKGLVAKNLAFKYQVK